MSPHARSSPWDPPSSRMHDDTRLGGLLVETAPDGSELRLHMNAIGRLIAREWRLWSDGTTWIGPQAQSGLTGAQWLAAGEAIAKGPPLPAYEGPAQVPDDGYDFEREE